MADTVVSAFARELVRTDFDTFAAATTHKAKLHLLDTFGVAIAGSASAETQSVLMGLGLKHATGRAAIWGTPYAADARTAAFVNGISAHALELDDSGGCDHSGAVVVPALVAALCNVSPPVSGRRFLRSMLLGYEAGRRVLEAVGGYETHNAQGWHSTGTCGVFGATAAVASLLEFDHDRMASSLGTAGSLAAGSWAFIHDGSPTKKLHAGRAAEGGVMAASLAAASFKGPASIFETDQWGSFFQAFGNGRADPGALIADFGHDWRLDRCSVKVHATCRGTHAAIDAVDLLLRQHTLRPDDVTRVEVAMSAFQFGMCGNDVLASTAQAQMSLPYAVAARLHYGRVSLAELEERAWNSSAIRSWLDRVAVSIDPQMPDEAEPRVTLTTKSGDRFSATVESPLGSPGNPLSDDQLIQKYKGLSATALPTQNVEGLQAFVLDLELKADVRDLLGLLQ